MKFLFLSVMMMFFLNAFPQTEINRFLYIANKDSSRIISRIPEKSRVKVVTISGENAKGRLTVQSDSLIAINGETFSIRDVKLLYCPIPTTMAAVSYVPTFFFPQMMFLSGTFTLIAINYNFRLKTNSLLVSDLGMSELREQKRIEKIHKDSLQRFSPTHDSRKSSFLSFNWKNTAHRSDPPNDFLYLGFDLEKIVVPNFSFNFDYFLCRHFGIEMQYAYKPLNPDGASFYMTWETEPDYFAENVMCRVNPVFTFSTKEINSRLFIGPSAFFKDMQMNNMTVCTQNYGDGDRFYSSYTRDKTVKGAGIRFGNIPIRHIGFAWSVELSYRKSIWHDRIVDYYYPQVQEEFGHTSYFNIDASFAIKFKIRKSNNRIK